VDERVGVTVSDQLFPEEREPCVLTPSTSAKTNCVCEVVLTENVMLCPGAIFERSIATFVNAGSAVTGTAAINKNATAVAAKILKTENPVFEINFNISFLHILMNLSNIIL
jgi:hypothetical protein